MLLFILTSYLLKGFITTLFFFWASLMTKSDKKKKNLPAMQETQVWSLGRGDALEKEIATHSTILAWETPWTEEPGGLQFMGSQELDTT